MELEDKVDELKLEVVEIKTIQRLLKEQLGPTIESFEKSIYELVAIKAEQKRIQKIDFDKVIDNRLREQYINEYEKKIIEITDASIESHISVAISLAIKNEIKEVILDSIELKVKEIRWNDLKWVSSTLVAIITLAISIISSMGVK